jgi:hypothetical protein
MILKIDLLLLIPSLYCIVTFHYMLIGDILEDCTSRIDWTRYPFLFLITRFSTIATAVAANVTDDKSCRIIITFIVVVVPIPTAAIQTTASCSSSRRSMEVLIDRPIGMIARILAPLQYFLTTKS